MNIGKTFTRIGKIFLINSTHVRMLENNMVGWVNIIMNKDSFKFADTLQDKLVFKKIQYYV